MSHHVEGERDFKRSDERGRNAARPADIESGMSHGKKEVEGGWLTRSKK